MADESEINFLQQKINILITGCTGVGKSTLVNKIFGQKVAKTGTGVPVTQHFKRFEMPDHSIVIYDSKGIEMGDSQNFIHTTRSFLKKGYKKQDVIHVCWYIINSAGSRFQPFEGEICKELFHNLPIIFILNKADLSSDSDRQAIRSAIEDLKLTNCVAIIDAICVPSLLSFNIPETCPHCGSDDLDVKRKKQLLECEDCGYEKTLIAKTGLEDVIMQTIGILPRLVIDQFVSAQKVCDIPKNK